MTSQDDIERILDRWFAEGPTEINDRVVESALDQIEHSAQQRVMRTPLWVSRITRSPVSVAIGAGVFLVALLGGGLILRSISSEVGGSPPPSASGQLPSPSAGATARVPGTTAIRPRAALSAGTTYSSLTFKPVFTIEGGAGWVLTQEGPGHLLFNHPPNALNEPGGFTFSLVVASAVLPPISSGAASSEPLPADLIAWLRARPDLTLGAPSSVTVGGIAGTAVEGTVRDGAATNGDSGINLICSADAPCSQNPTSQASGEPIGQAWETEVNPGRPFRLVVLVVRGQTVVIGMNDAGNEWANAVKLLDPFLAGLRFPATGS